MMRSIYLLSTVVDHPLTSFDLGSEGIKRLPFVLLYVTIGFLFRFKRVS